MDTLERITEAKDGAVATETTDPSGNTTVALVQPEQRTRLCMRCVGGGCRSCNGAGFYKREW